VAGPYFTKSAFKFLKDLEANNNREWFKANKPRYEAAIKEPAVHFITDFGPYLKKLSPNFRADPRPVGGSMFRIYRDVRFSRDKSPYKTVTGIQFRHDLGKDAHAPGFYLHIEVGGCFVALGCWHPDGPSLRKIREGIADDGRAWKRAVGGKRFRETYALEGESLKRPPRDFDPEHPLIEDLKRKDFIAVTQVPQKYVTSPDLPKQLASTFRGGVPLMKFLCEALGVPF
jgi:uncharacterized protein (TIGR02453 family)